LKYKIGLHSEVNPSQSVNPPINIRLINKNKHISTLGTKN